MRAYATPPRNKGILEFLIVAACLELLGAWWLLVNPHRAIADIGDMSLRPGKTSQVEVIPGK